MNHVIISVDSGSSILTHQIVSDCEYFVITACSLSKCDITLILCFVHVLTQLVDHEWEKKCGKNSICVDALYIQSQAPIANQRMCMPCFFGLALRGIWPKLLVQLLQLVSNEDLLISTCVAEVLVRWIATSAFPNATESSNQFCFSSQLIDALIENEYLHSFQMFRLFVQFLNVFRSKCKIFVSNSHEQENVQYCHVAALSWNIRRRFETGEFLNFSIACFSFEERVFDCLELFMQQSLLSLNFLEPMVILASECLQSVQQHAVFVAHLDTEYQKPNLKRCPASLKWMESLGNVTQMLLIHFVRNLAAKMDMYHFYSILKGLHMFFHDSNSHCVNLTFDEYLHVLKLLVESLESYFESSASNCIVEKSNACLTLVVIFEILAIICFNVNSNLAIFNELIKRIIFLLSNSLDEQPLWFLSEQDDWMIDFLNSALICSSKANLFANASFLHERNLLNAFLLVVCNDLSLVVDMLVSNETSIFVYFSRILKVFEKSLLPTDSALLASLLPLLKAAEVSNHFLRPLCKRVEHLIL